MSKLQSIEAEAEQIWSGDQKGVSNCIPLPLLSLFMSRLLLLLLPTLNLLLTLMELVVFIIILTIVTLF